MNARQRLLAALAAGILFGLGLGISGMTRPSKVLAFLDFAGAWDPSLAFVMIGAIAVHMVAVRAARRRASPLGGAPGIPGDGTGDSFHLTKLTAVDAPLLIGSLVFGIGWGLGGFCPGPALTSAASGNALAIFFVVAMAAGMVARHASARNAA